MWSWVQSPHWVSDTVCLLLASIAQLGERKTEDLEARCSIHRRSNNHNGIYAGLINVADLKSAGLWAPPTNQAFKKLSLAHTGGIESCRLCKNCASET